MSSQFWKPGSEKPRFLEDEEGGVVLFSPSLASSSSGYHSFTLNPKRITVMCYWFFGFAFVVMDMLALRSRDKDYLSTSIVTQFSTWSRLMPLLSLLVRLGVAKPLRFLRSVPCLFPFCVCTYSIYSCWIIVLLWLILQYLKEAGWADGGRVIACTQPRRLAVQVMFLSF